MKSENMWIRSPLSGDDSAVYAFKKSFASNGELKKACLSITAMGIYKAELNGKKVGNGLLTPGFTSYNHRLLYQTYDVTDMISDSNELSVGVARGWAVGYFTYWQQQNIYADHTSLAAVLEVEYTDGRKERLCTDESWQVYTTEIISSEIYFGETVDKTAEIKLIGNAVKDSVDTELMPQQSGLVTENERLKPVRIITTPKGERVIDFGQNMAGYVEVTVKGKRGDRIVIHHGEVLDGDGNFYNANYRHAISENVYILSGGTDVFKPSYSFQGFRYVRLTEYPFENVELDSFRAVVIHTDMKRTGYFKCGNEKINRLYNNILWSQKSNFIDIPTDCPQRDERLGWLADAQVFFRTAAFNYDVESFFAKWLTDVMLEQDEDGSIGGVVPDCQPKRELISAAWGDAVCIIPWRLYLTYGSRELLCEHFPMMKKWVDYIKSSDGGDYLWLGGLHFGDWMALDSKPGSYFGATSNDLIATAFYAHSTELLIKAGEVIGEDMTEYKKLHDGIVKAFRNYFMENGMPKESLPVTEKLYDERVPMDRYHRGITQTSLALILYFNLCEEKDRDGIANKLAELIRCNGMRLNTGFVGTPYLLHALSENGYNDIAYELLLQEKFPSWLYAVNRGATTVWEHWDGIREDGSFWSDGSNSFNHYAYGSVFDWVIEKVCGIIIDESAPAYKKIRIEPHPDRRLGNADISLETRNGRLRVHWYYEGDTVRYEFEIPDGIEAAITVPERDTEICSNGVFRR